jgi:hypothetical protein
VVAAFFYTDGRTDGRTDRQTDRQTDKDDEANGCFSQFCEQAEQLLYHNCKQAYTLCNRPVQCCINLFTRICTTCVRYMYSSVIKYCTTRIWKLHCKPQTSMTCGFLPNNIWWGVQSIKLLFMQSSPLPCHIIPLRPKYPTQHPILENPQPTFLPQCERRSLTTI